MGDILQMQPQQVHLPVNADEFNVLIAALKQLPYVVSQPLIDRFRAHAKEQLGEI